MTLFEKLSSRISLLAKRIGGEFCALSVVSKTGSYNDLLNKPEIPIVPNNVSEFINDAQYTSKTYVDNAVAGVDSLPSQVGQSGKILGTDGSGASWITVPSDPNKADVTTVDNKADKDFSNVTKPYVVEQWVNGVNWYRIWSDKWVEQGTRYTAPDSDGVITWTFHVEMANTDYTPTRTIASTNSSTISGYRAVAVQSRKTNSISFWSNASQTSHLKIEGYKA